MNQFLDRKYSYIKTLLAENSVEGQVKHKFSQPSPLLTETSAAAAILLNTDTQTNLSCSNIAEKSLFYSGETVIIKDEGYFKLKGLKEKIIIDAPKKNVTIELGNSIIHSCSGPAFNVRNAGKITIKLADKSRSFIVCSDRNCFAVSSNIPLNLEGCGTAYIKAAGGGIKSAKGLTINNGIYKIKTAKAAVFSPRTDNTPPEVRINGGTLTINSENDCGILSAGSVIFNGSCCSLNAISGIYASAEVSFNDGVIRISAQEYGIFSDNSDINFINAILDAEGGPSAAAARLGRVTVKGGCLRLSSTGSDEEDSTVYAGDRISINSGRIEIWPKRDAWNCASGKTVIQNEAADIKISQRSLRK